MMAEVRRLKDELQVAEMRASEERRMREVAQADNLQLQKHATYYWRQMEKAQELARVACDQESEMRRQVQVTERDLRALEFRNLSLQRKRKSLSNTVPVSEHERMRSDLELRVAQQAEQLTTLREELAERDAAAESEGMGGRVGSVGWEEHTDSK